MKAQKTKARNNAALALCLIAALILICVPFILTNGNNGEEPVDSALSKLVINEVSANGQQSIYDEDGDYSDFAEIYNPTDEEVSLDGVFLTDNLKKFSKYAFPEGTVIGPGEYLLVFCSGKDMTDIYIHTNFSLSAGETLFIYSPRYGVIDQVTVTELPKGTSAGRDIEDPSKWVYYTVPTPGFENFTTAYPIPQETGSVKGLPVYISEVLTSSEGSDFIELHNTSSHDISLAGWTLSDGKKVISKWKFPDDAVIKGDSYMLIWADGTGTFDGENYHTSFKLAKYDEKVILGRGEAILDSIEWGVSRREVSMGINSEADIQKRFYTVPTPGRANSEDFLTGIAPVVNFSKSAGLYKDNFELTLTTFDPDTLIYYTLDGSLPDRNSKLYMGPIYVDKNTVVTAIGVSAGRMDSEVACQTYIIGDRQTLPVIFLNMEPDTFDFIYHSYSYRPDVRANITLVEEDGTVGFSEEVYAALHGNMSVFNSQKSFSIKFRGAVGKSSINYDLFPDDPTRTTEFRSFILRTGGNDWDVLKIKDGMLQTLGARTMDLDYQGFRSCIVYINGEYWGLYNIREKQNEDYLASYYGIDPDNVDIISFGHGVHEGDYEEYDRLINFVSTKDLNDPDNWAQLETMMDVDNMIDTYLMHIYYSNFDTVNIKWWREKTPDAKWRWLTYDLDYSMFFPKRDDIARLANPAGHGVDNIFPSTLMYNLMKSSFFRERYLERIERCWDNIFAPDVILEHWYSLDDRIQPEFRRNMNRWGYYVDLWFDDLFEGCYEFIVNRQYYFRQHIHDNFGLSWEEIDERFPLHEATIPMRLPAWTDDIKY